jgi:hypothetical protein
MLNYSSSTFASFCAGIEKPLEPLFYKVLGLFAVWRLKGLARLLLVVYRSLTATGIACC